MTETTIPVDLRNPGQIFACIGLMEVAEALGFDDVEGWFDWNLADSTSFTLASLGERDSLEEILRFLRESTVEILVPIGLSGPWPEGVMRTSTFPSPIGELLKSNKKDYSASALPVMLTRGTISVAISSWLEGDGRKSLKTFAGQQVAAKVLVDLLSSTTKAVGIRQMFPEAAALDVSCAFRLVGPVSSRFSFDGRGAWDALGLGTSLDATGTLVKVSPLVEVLALIGLENARPIFLETYLIRYSVWSEKLPTMLARAALSDASQILAAAQVRNFHASLGSDQQYKKCFFSQEIF